MNSDEGKLFVGGIAWDTTEEKLRDYFGQYGDVSQTVIMREKTTGRPRGFGFVVFSEPSVLDAVLNEKHTIDGRMVEAKRALSKEEQQTSSQVRNFASGRSSGGGGGVNFSTKKIFVGGLPSTLTEDVFRQFFESFGQITDVVIMYDQTTQRPRGFGFITFDCEEAVERVLCKNFHELNGKAVEVKRALPKDSNPAAGIGGPGGGGASHGYQNYANATANVYDNNNHRTVQAQIGGSFAPSYSGYGYGIASSAVGYGGYGAGGYGYGGASYGNPNSVGFVGAMKTVWGSGQAPPTGFGAAGFAPRGPATSGASGYGYANYAAAGNYGPPYAGGYGGRAPGAGDQQGSSGGYGDSSSGWRSDPSRGGYGGSALSRQV